MRTAMERYTVIVSDGEAVDRNLRPIAPAIRNSCGHNHRSYEAANECRAKLLGYHREATGNLVCSATWYNSRIHRHEGDSMDYIREAPADQCARMGHDWVWDARPEYAGKKLCLTCGITQ